MTNGKKEAVSVKSKVKVKSEEKKSPVKKEPSHKTALKPGQKYPTPTSGAGDRVFYETLLRQKPDSLMAQEWCLAHGLLPLEEATKLFIKIDSLKRKSSGAITSKKNDGLKRKSSVAATAASTSPARKRQSIATKKRVSTGTKKKVKDDVKGTKMQSGRIETVRSAIL